MDTSLGWLTLGCVTAVVIVAETLKTNALKTPGRATPEGRPRLRLSFERPRDAPLPAQASSGAPTIRFRRVTSLVQSSRLARDLESDCIGPRSDADEDGMRRGRASEAHVAGPIR